MRSLKFFLIAVIASASMAHAAGDVALVTALNGKTDRAAITGPVPVEPFVKLKEGDVLTLGKGAFLRLVYFEGGRQEDWKGPGRIEAGSAESRAAGAQQTEVKTLPAVVVRQMAKTPALDSQGRAGVTRLRAIGSPNSLDKLEAEYDRLRMESGGKDLNAEIYMLSGLFELRELERVEYMINDLQLRQKGNTEAMVLVSLYRKALNSARAVR